MKFRLPLMCNLMGVPSIHRPFKSYHHLLPKHPTHTSALPPQSQKIPRDSFLKKPELFHRLQSDLHGSAKALGFTMPIKDPLLYPCHTPGQGECVLWEWLAWRVFPGPRLSDSILVSPVVPGSTCLQEVIDTGRIVEKLWFVDCRL